MTKRRNKRQTPATIPQSVAGQDAEYPLVPFPVPALRSDRAALEGLERAVGTREIAVRAEARAVAGAREVGFSWDRIGVYLDVSGETLRRRHGGGGR